MCRVILIAIVTLVGCAKGADLDGCLRTESTTAPSASTVQSTSSPETEASSQSPVQVLKDLQRLLEAKVWNHRNNWTTRQDRIRRIEQGIEATEKSKDAATALQTETSWGSRYVKAQHLLDSGRDDAAEAACAANLLNKLACEYEGVEDKHRVDLRKRPAP